MRQSVRYDTALEQGQEYDNCSRIYGLSIEYTFIYQDVHILFDNRV